MNEDLVGYLLGALDRDAAEGVEKELTKKPELRRELDRIGSALRPLEEDKADVDPPAGLAERSARRVLRQARRESPIASVPGPWRLTDLAVAAGILLVISVVIFPAIAQSRQQQLVTECKSNLRQIGVAMESYAGTHGRYFPFYGTTGPLAEELYPFVGWEQYLTPPRRCSSTELLDRAGLLTSSTLAVHCVHVTLSDAE